MTSASRSPSCPYNRIGGGAVSRAPEASIFPSSLLPSLSLWKKEEEEKQIKNRFFPLFVWSFGGGSEKKSGGGGEVWMRGGAAARTAPSKRQLRALAIDSVSDEANGEMGSDGGSWSEGEEALCAAPTSATTNLRSRKRVKLNGNVLEDYGPVDPAMVPRRLRSAINKRCSLAASPLVSDAKRNHLASHLNGVMRPKQNMFNSLITKDEAEVAETLSSLASMVFVGKPVEDKEDKRMLIDNLETEVPTSPSEASKEEGTKLLGPCNRFEATNTCVESGKESTKAVPSVTEQLINTPGSQRIDPESNKTAQIDIERTLLIRKEEVENLSLSDAGKLLKPLGFTSEVYFRNRFLQPTQLDTLPDGKPVLGWPLGSSLVEHEEHPVKQKSYSCAQHLSRGETTVVRPGLADNANGHLTMSSLRKTASRPDTFACAARPGLTKNGLKTEKLRPTSADHRRSRSRCVTHVSICHLIQNHQSIDKKRQLSLPSNQLKVKEGANFVVQTTNEIVEPRNGLHSNAKIGANGFVMDKNLHEASSRMLQDVRLLQAQQASIPFGTIAKQKPGSFHGLSTTGETQNPGYGSSSREQLTIPYVRSQVQHPAVIPFPFPHGPYTSPYAEHLAGSATQQIPHYLGNPFYGPYMGGASKQQQMWPAHLAHFRPQMGILKWQNGRLPDPTLIPCAQPPCTVPAQPSIEVVGTAGTHRSGHQQQHQHLPLPPSSSSSSRANRECIHQDGSGGLHPEVPTQLHLLCNTHNR